MFTLRDCYFCKNWCHHKQPILWMNTSVRRLIYLLFFCFLFICFFYVVFVISFYGFLFPLYTWISTRPLLYQSVGHTSNALSRDHLLISTRRTGIRYPNDNRSGAGYLDIGGWWPHFINFLDASTHFQKWGPKERPTLDSIGPRDIIIDHQFNEITIHV